jgi:hypothetical protein
MSGLNEEALTSLDQTFILIHVHVLIIIVCTLTTSKALGALESRKDLGGVFLF